MSSLFRTSTTTRSTCRPDDLQACIVLVDPFSTATEALLNRLDQLAPGIPVIGGVASWASAPGRNRLAQDGEVTNSGLVGVTLRGDVRVSTIVSQGCRPVGDWFTVTSSRSNLVQELDGKPPLEVLQEVFAEASSEDQKLMRSGILLGRGVAQQPDDLGHGSFIIRVVLGADRESGAISVADRVREGEYVQFHVRDAQSARDDLEMLLTPQVFEDTAAGALLFTCNGRGERFFGERDADVAIIGNAPGRAGAGDRLFLRRRNRPYRLGQLRARLYRQPGGLSPRLRRGLDLTLEGRPLVRSIRLSIAKVSLRGTASFR